ncbi:MAG: peroxiredoxin family protein [Oceanicaulis sp.]
MIRPLAAAFATTLTLALSAPAAGFAQDAARAAAEAAADLGPAVGARSPVTVFTDASGAQRSLAELSGRNGMVIYFNRSLDWCPICLRQALEVNAAAEQFDAAGWRAVVLTYDDAETLARVADRRIIDLALIPDPDIEVIDAFGVRDPIYADPDHMAHGVPYPIAVAIRPDGTIAAKFWHEAGLGARRGYATRVTVADVLGALNQGARP